MRLIAMSLRAGKQSTTFPPRLCVECEHYMEHHESGALDVCCRRTTELDLVRGHRNATAITECRTERLPGDGRCGADGRFWSRRPTA